MLGESGPDRRLRILVFTSLYPSEARPRHGIFVETRLAHLVRDCDVEARVVAPVPWFPSRSAAFGEYARFAATPRRAARANGLAVTHPRYLMLPKIGVGLQPDSMALAARRDIRALVDGGWQPDLIDSHYLYPDGVAAATLARHLGLPFVMTARGTDVNVLAHLPGPGGRIVAAAKQAAAVIAVSDRLKDQLIALGVDAAKVTVLRNGVDLEVFNIEDRRAARAGLGLPLDGPLAACVGNLVPEKGQALAIEALQDLPELRLVIVGEGPLRDDLGALARRLGVESRVHFLPAMPQRELCHVYGASNVLLLTSTREGWPNVVLEAMACGTPVVGFDVGAAREMIVSDQVGRIVASRDRAALAAAIRQVLADPIDRTHLRDHAAQFDWSSVSRRQMEIFSRVTGVVTQRGSTLRPAR